MELNLKEQILSAENIYKAIYALESYISERDLLGQRDSELFLKLRDKYDFGGNIGKIVEQCQDKLTRILEDKKELFEIAVYFKIKKLSSYEPRKVEYRPLHTSCLINQICMAALLMPLMFDDSTGRRNLSELSRMLPSNFYGNIPSCNVSQLFARWTDKYRQYSEIVSNKSREYSKTHEYDTVIGLDLEDFFPSIDPRKILSFIWNSISDRYNEEDKKTLLTVITKLLYFKIPEKNIEGWHHIYFKDNREIKSVDGFYPARGIAQGLPQSYFFGNLCMIDIADKMKNAPGLQDSDSYFYVDDSVVFARNIDDDKFRKLIGRLNITINDSKTTCGKEPPLENTYKENAEKIEYCFKFHTDDKSTICDIDDSFIGMDGLFLVQRTVSMGGWIKGNIDEVDDNVAFKKLKALEAVIDNELKKIKEKREHMNYSSYGESRQKWLNRYRRYFIFRKRKLQLMLKGQFDEQLLVDFKDAFYFKEIIGNERPDEDTINHLFEKFDEDIFKSWFELLLTDMPSKIKAQICENVRNFDIALSKYCNDDYRNIYYLFYNQISSSLLKSSATSINEYDSLARIVRKTIPFRKAERFIELVKIKSAESDDLWKLFPFLHQITDDDQTKESEWNPTMEFPDWCGFIFRNSNNFKRKILNCCFSIICNIQPGDNLAIIRSDIKPIRYYELRIISFLRNYRFNLPDFITFISSINMFDVTERMEIDLGILEALGIFRQRVQDPMKIDSLILTHRMVKSLWHNGSKFLNAYTLHNQEHAINLIKNVVRIINNVDFLNLKSNDFFILFNACYLHDISMVVHPNVASFNDSNAKAEKLISKWINMTHDIENRYRNAFEISSFDAHEIKKIRKDVGLALVESFQDVFDFFENRVRGPHASDSARFIRSWHSGMLSYLSELEVDTIAKVSDSHGWDTMDVYEIASSAKDELVSLKYMMILIRLADLLDLASDRIDYFLLKQNRSQMNVISRFHWISHLITDKYELDVDYEVDKDSELYEQPIKEHIFLDIFLNTEILAKLKVNKNPCKGIHVNFGERKQSRYGVETPNRNCMVFSVGTNEDMCKFCDADEKSHTCTCPFLCRWMADRHYWLFKELGKLCNYLNSVNSKLIHSDITVRFFYDNNHKLDPEFYDDVKTIILKSE